MWQYQFRIIMLGDSTVGKSSLVRRYTENLFLDSISQTVGVDFYVHFLEVEQGVRVKLQFWDTAGQERFRYGRNLSFQMQFAGLSVSVDVVEIPLNAYLNLTSWQWHFA